MSGYDYPLAAFSSIGPRDPNLTLLTSEIAASSIASALDGINISGTTYTFMFVGPLTSAEQTVLDAIVVAHTGAETPAEQFVETLHPVPPTPSDDEVQGYSLGSRWLVDSGMYICTDSAPGAAVWILATAPRFEPEHFYSEFPKPNTHTSTSLLAANKLGVSVEGGVYSLEWYYEWAENYTSAAFVAEIRVDELVVGNHFQNPKDSNGTSALGSKSGTDQIHPAHGFWEGSLGAGEHIVSIVFATERSNKAATIYRSRLRLVRIK